MGALRLAVSLGLGDEDFSFGFEAYPDNVQPKGTCNQSSE